MYSGLLRWWPTLSARVPIASYLVQAEVIQRTLCLCYALMYFPKTRLDVELYSQDEQILVLVLVEGEYQGLQDEPQVRHLVRRLAKVRRRREGGEEEKEVRRRGR